MAPAVERAFTMIEIIVAMVLLAIAFAMVGTSVVQAISGAAGTRSGSVSDGAVARTLSALQRDVATAATPDRTDGSLRDPNDFASAVRENDHPRTSDPSIEPTSPEANIFIDDVTEATPTRLQLVGDFATSAGFECVTWQAETNASGYRLRRVLSPYVKPAVPGGAVCTGAPLSSQTFVKAPASVIASGKVDTTPFRYKLMCNRTLCPTGSMAPTTSPCSPWIADTVATSQRRWVVGIEATLSQVAEGRAGAGGSGAFSGAVASRATDTYGQALGC